jgi:hypothetical protein
MGCRPIQSEVTNHGTPSAYSCLGFFFCGERSVVPGSTCLPSLLHFRDSYGLLDHLNSNGFSNTFDYWSDRLFHFPRSFLHWCAFGLGPGSRFRFRSLTCLTSFS